ARRRNLLVHLSIAPVEPRVQGSATEGSRGPPAPGRRPCWMPTQTSCWRTRKPSFS
ncbi:unnamed protein product, partial [Pylaiella littoralis]